MYFDPNYTLQRLADTPYLLPFGQGIAQFHKQLRLNESSTVLLTMIRNHPKLSELSLEELSADLGQEFCRKMKLDSSECPEAEQDIHEFLKTLLSMGVLAEERQPRWESQMTARTLAPIEPVMEEIRSSMTTPAASVFLADMKLQFYMEDTLSPDQLLSREFSAFHTPLMEPGAVFHYYFLRAEKKPVFQEAAPLIDHPQLQVFPAEKGFAILFPASEQIDTAFLSEDGTCACFLLTDTADAEAELFRYDIFHAIRLIFSYGAMLRGYFLIHSASILYRDKAWLFSAPSGTGKSTHAALWMQLYENEVRYLNGDLNLLSMAEGAPKVYGIPWNGTSNLYSTERVPLGGIIFLQQEKTDVIEELTGSCKTLFLIQRFISPNWTEPLLLRHLQFAEELIPHIYLKRLSCTKEPSAAALLRKDIDKNL